MSANQKEIEKRTIAALSAISKAFGTEDDDYGASLFVTHHLEELEQDYWLKHLGTANPDPIQVLSILVLRSHWGDDDEEENEGIEIFDFTLPGEVTDYVICVQFNENGNVEKITMGS